MIELEILESSYWEHFKSAKDLSLYLPITHPKRVRLQDEINKISEKMQILKRKKIGLMKTKSGEYTINYTESTDGGFVGTVKELPGVSSQGETVEDLLINLKDAIELVKSYNILNKTK